MTAAMMFLSPSEAQRLTQRIKLTATNIRDNLVKLRNLVDEARNSNAWSILGFQSWTAYLADTLADEPMRLGREERQELVGYLAGEGLSTRAIAPIVGVSPSTVKTDVQVASSGHLAEADEVIDAEIVEEPTPAPRPITGLDGKSYTAKPVAPPAAEAVSSGPSMEQLNAEQACTSLGRALETALGLTVQARRDLIRTEWWPLGSASVPPAQRDLFTARELRGIAIGLNQMANELEAAR